MAKHQGFKAVQSKIEGEGYSKKAAGAILASRTRNASAKAKAKNPRLKRVKGCFPKIRPCARNAAACTARGTGRRGYASRTWAFVESQLLMAT